MGASQDHEGPQGICQWVGSTCLGEAGAISRQVECVDGVWTKLALVKAHTLVTLLLEPLLCFTSGTAIFACGTCSRAGAPTLPHLRSRGRLYASRRGERRTHWSAEVRCGGGAHLLHIEGLTCCVYLHALWCNTILFGNCPQKAFDEARVPRLDEARVP